VIDVAIIGAGPSGTIAAMLLAKAGWTVEIVDRETFPRFSIGESLLPQAMTWLEEAGVLQDVVEAGFQYKNGAAFRWGEAEEVFDFRDKSSEGWGTTYQVRRDRFDLLLAEAAQRKGISVRFGESVVGMCPSAERPTLKVRDASGVEREIQARFVLDASGFGRVLARTLSLDKPAASPRRTAIFTHVRDQHPFGVYDRNKILISINEVDPAIWYWMIPLAEGLVSVGVVGEPHRLKPYGATREERFDALVRASGRMGELMGDAPRVRDISEIQGYACNVSSLTGPGYALLGNAGEFLDPVFSSGLTIALKSASLAAGVLNRQLQDETVDWESEFSEPLMQGVNAFRSYVNAWYDGSLPRILFASSGGSDKIRKMITSILAGYAWDDSNPFVRRSEEYLKLVDDLRQ